MNFLLSVVVPAYNEAPNLPDTLDALGAFARSQPGSTEIVLVDDGSEDGTWSLLSAFAARNLNAMILRNPVNKGKGYSIRRGLLACHGRYALFTDADLAYSLDDAQRFVKALSEGFDVVAGSRILGGAPMAAEMSRPRLIAGRVFRALVSLVVLAGISDSQCGYKGFSRKAVEQIMPRMRVDGFAFDVEIFYLAQKRGLRIKEIGVTLRKSQRSSLNLLWDSLRMTRDIIRIRLNGLMAIYDKDLQIR